MASVADGENCNGADEEVQLRNHPMNNRSHVLAYCGIRKFSKDDGPPVNVSLYVTNDIDSLKINI